MVPNRAPTRGTYPAFYARLLLADMHAPNSTFNDTWAMFWATQPGAEDLFTPDLWTDEHLDALQAPELV